MGITADLSKDFEGIQQLNEMDIRQLHLLIMDYFAAAFAGYKLNKSFNDAVESVVYPQRGVEESTILFQKRKYPARTAAFMNSLYGHGAELDDGNKEAAGHAGVHVIPAVFSLADKLGSSNDDVLRALATGYEAYIRISAAAQPGLILRGFHSTGMAGTLACAAACARLFHMDSKGIEDAIALATTMTGGLLSYGDSRPEIKPLNPGKAAENGVFAAMLAKSGVNGPRESLEGKNGWFNAVTEKVHNEYLKGKDYLLLHDCYLKLYPSCRHTHCGIDAAIKLHGRVKPEEIEKISIYIYPNAIKLAGIKLPKTRDETKFSIQYTFARAFVNGFYGVDDISPSCLTKEVLDVIDRTELIPDTAMEDRQHGIRGTKVDILKTNGQAESETVLFPKGDPENPLSETDILNKLRMCSEGLVKVELLDKLVNSIREIKGPDSFYNPMEISVASAI